MAGTDQCSRKSSTSRGNSKRGCPNHWLNCEPTVWKSLKPSFGYDCYVSLTAPPNSIHHYKVFSLKKRAKLENALFCSEPEKKERHLGVEKLCKEWWREMLRDGREPQLQSWSWQENRPHWGRELTDGVPVTHATGHGHRGEGDSHPSHQAQLSLTHIHLLDTELAAGSSQELCVCQALWLLNCCRWRCVKSESRVLTLLVTEGCVYELTHGIPQQGFSGVLWCSDISLTTPF